MPGEDAFTFTSFADGKVDQNSHLRIKIEGDNLTIGSGVKYRSIELFVPDTKSRK